MFSSDLLSTSPPPTLQPNAISFAADKTADTTTTGTYTYMAHHPLYVQCFRRRPLVSGRKVLVSIRTYKYAKCLPGQFFSRCSIKFTAGFLFRLLERPPRLHPSAAAAVHSQYLCTLSAVVKSGPDFPLSRIYPKYTYVSIIVVPVEEVVFWAIHDDTIE